MPNSKSTAGAVTDRDPPRHGSVDVWKVPLSFLAGTIARFEGTLSPEEIQKSRRILFARDRARFIISRGALRSILSGYVNERPGNLVFGYEARGKPFLAHPLAACRIQFNVSHCVDFAAIAVCTSRSIGIDVETVRALPDRDRILERFFGGEERACVESAGNEARDRIFLQIWTRREAATKALGLDLSAAVSDLGIPFFPPGNGIRLGDLRTVAQDVPPTEEGWFLQDLPLDASHVGAICLEGGPCEIAFSDFTDTWAN